MLLYDLLHPPFKIWFILLVVYLVILPSVEPDSYSNGEISKIYVLHKNFWLQATGLLKSMQDSSESGTLKKNMKIINDDDFWLF